MDNQLLAYASSFLSIIALLLSGLSYINDRRKLTTEAITKNRIDWICKVRNHLSEFLILYMENGGGDLELQKVKYQLRLYLNEKNPDHVPLIAALNACTDSPIFIAEKSDDLVRKSETLISLVWRRMKIEAGIGYRQERAIAKKLKEQNEKYSRKKASAVEEVQK